MSLLARLLAESGAGVPPATPATSATLEPKSRRVAKVANAASVGTEVLRSRLVAQADAEGRAVELARAVADDVLRDLAAFGMVGDDALRALLSLLHDDAERKAGRVPAGHTAAILCRSCGPVFVHPSIAAVLPVVDGWPRALGCPWCFIRADGGFIPRPKVSAADCAHWHADTVNPAGGRGQCRCGSWWPHQAHGCGDFTPRGSRA